MTPITGTTRLVGILGWPVEHSLSPRMHNAAFAELGLDWAYVPLPTPPERLAQAVEGLAALGFVGANVTAPHKLAAARICGAEEPSVNTLLVRDGRVEARSTDAAILEGLPTEHPVVLGDGGAATAFLEALPHARRYSRRGEWPPVADDADLVVNATAARDEVLVELGAGPDARRPAVPGDGDGRRGEGGGRARRDGPRRPRRAGSRLVRALDRRPRPGRGDAGRDRRQVTD